MVQGMANINLDTAQYWRRSPLLPLAVLWAVLWALVSLIEFPGYLHDHALPLWQPLVLAVVPAVTIVIWLVVELRSSRYLAPALEPPKLWFAHHLWRLPMLATAYIVIVFSLQHGLFALGGAQLQEPPRFIYEYLKSGLFYCLWLGLVYGTLSSLKLREQAAQMGLIQQALIKSQLAQLQAQLRPHFLFNALNTVSALMHSDVQRADRVLTKLGDLLRASLGVGANSMVPLQDEIELLKLYATIMEERFSGRVVMEWQIAGHAISVPVPTMLLQPLLENAFKYGIEQTTSHERIRMIATCDDYRLRVSIHNTGSVLQLGWREGIGITNCRERLHVLYGLAATVNISNDSQGVVALVVLPLRAHPE